MCGFVGIFGTDALSFKCRLHESLNIIKHRGPDYSGIFESSKCLLGHCRLAIIDTSERANQPMIYKNSVLAFNGEIYNHLKLRKSLVTNEFRTNSDTETLLMGLIESKEFFLIFKINSKSST